MKEKKTKKIIRIIIKLILFFIVIYVGIGIYKESKIEILDEEYMKQLNSNSIIKDEITVKKVIADIPTEYLGYEVTARLEIPEISLDTNVLKEYNEDSLKMCVSKFWGANPNEVR